MAPELSWPEIRNRRDTSLSDLAIERPLPGSMAARGPPQTSTVGREFFVLDGCNYASGVIADIDGVSEFGGDNSGMRMFSYVAGVRRAGLNARNHVPPCAIPSRFSTHTSIVRLQAYVLSGFSLHALERMQKADGGKPSEHIGVNITVIGCDTTKDKLTFSEMLLGDVTPDQRNEFSVLRDTIMESSAGMCALQLSRLCAHPYL